uniref:Repressor protein n=1 Tax=Solanum tuberosum TaxID=4113 RepID=M1DLF8_SOLTU
MGDNNEEIGLTDVIVAQPVIADQNKLIMQLMQQITKMRVEMQRIQDLPNLGFAFNAPADGWPPLHFPPSNAEQAQNPPSAPAQNPSIIDLTTQNPHFASVSYQTLPPPQSTNHQAPLHPQNANLQACPPSQNQNVNHPNTFFHQQNQYTSPQTFPQNYQPPQNAQGPSIAPPLPQKPTFQIPVPNEHDPNGSELDHYEDREREWRSNE